MEIWVDIIDVMDESDYRIHKGFRRKICGPLSYFVHTLGLDYTPRKAKEEHKKHTESIYRKPNEKFYDFLDLFMPRKKKRKNKSKKKRHEEVEEVV